MKIGGGTGQSKKSGTQKPPSRKKERESKYFRPISPSSHSSRSSRASSRNSLSPLNIPNFEEYSNRPPTPPINIPKKKNPKVALEEAVYKDEINFQAALRYHEDTLRQAAEDRERRERYQRDYAAKKIQKITRGNQSRKNNKPLIDELKWEKDMEKKMKQLLREKKKKAWMERIKKRSKIGTQQLVGGRKTRRKKRTRRKGRRGRASQPPILSIFKEGRGIKKTPRRRGNSNYTQKHKPSPRVRTAFHKSNR
jgi:hypothetical protein